MTTQKSITSVPLTDGQRRQYHRFVEDAAHKALVYTGLDKDRLQKLIENGDEFRSLIITGIRKLSVSSQFVDEEVESSSAYPKSYKVKGITEQTNILRQLFPGIGNALEKIAEQPLPPSAEGWFAIPKWQTLAPTYNEAVEKVLAMIAMIRNGRLYNYCEGNLGPQRLRQHARTVVMWKKLGDQQEQDILVVPAQFGLRHRGRSVRRAREMFNGSEFGLGSFAVGIMLLTHPERLQHYDDLWIDCAGDEYDAPCAEDVFSYAPYFKFDIGKVGFNIDWYSRAYEVYGSASGFLPI